MRSAELLASLECVDSTRIGCLGFSMGAYRSWMLAALSDRIAASASVCWMNTTEHLMTMTNNQNKGGSAYSMIVPGLRRFMDWCGPDAALGEWAFRTFYREGYTALCLNTAADGSGRFIPSSRGRNTCAWKRRALWSTTTATASKAC